MVPKVQGSIQLLQCRLFHSFYSLQAGIRPPCVPQKVSLLDEVWGPRKNAEMSITEEQEAVS